MKLLYAAGGAIFLAALFMSGAYAIELCEPQDYYSLANSSKCTIPDNTTGDDSGFRERMFQALENYPYESKAAFVQLLERKVGRVDDHLTRKRGLAQTDKGRADIRSLELIQRDLSTQLVLVRGARGDNWAAVRDAARRSLEDASLKLREIE